MAKVAVQAEVTIIPEIEIEKIIIPEDRHRTLDFQKAEVIKDSIESLGLINAITLSPTLVLIAGLHRIAAFKSMGLSTIPYNIKSYDEIDQELAEIDENLIRFDLTKMERKLHVARRMELYKQKFGDVKEVDTSEFDVNDEENEDENPGVRISPRTGKPMRPYDPLDDKFIRDTAKVTGRGETTIWEDVKDGKRINSLLSPEVRDLIAPTKLADNGLELGRLLDIPDEEQRTEVATLINEYFQKDPSKKVTIAQAKAELGINETFEDVASDDGHATLEKALKKCEALLQNSVARPDFKDVAETWTQTGAMVVRDQFITLQKTTEKGIKILDKVIDRNTKLNKK